MENPKVEVNTEGEREVFRTFAQLYPHEAAECNWPEFVKMTREVAGVEIPEDDIRRMLKKTEA